MRSRSTLLPGKPSGFLRSKCTSSNILLRDCQRQKDEQSKWKKRHNRKPENESVFKDVKVKAKKSLCGKQRSRRVTRRS